MAQISYNSNKTLLYTQAFPMPTNFGLQLIIIHTFTISKLWNYKNFYGIIMVKSECKNVQNHSSPTA